MRNTFKIFLIVTALSFTAASLSLAADDSKGYDKYGNPLPGTQTSVNPPLKGTGPAPVAEGNRIQPESVSVDPLPCKDLQYRGDTVLPAHRGDDYICDPGYECRGVVGGFQCGWRNLSSLAANSPYCKFDSCNEMLLRQGLENIKH